jgi:hypothetical protein
MIKEKLSGGNVSGRQNIQVGNFFRRRIGD